MHVIALVRSIGRTVSRNRVRALVMTAGVSVGIASLTAISSIGESSRRETVKRFRNMLGTYDTIMVRPGAGKSRGMVSLTNVDPTLTFGDADALAQISSVRSVAELQNAFDIDVTYHDRTRTPAIFGVSPNWTELRGDEIAEGVFITADDDRTLARVAVLGSDAKSDLFPDEDPVGKTIRIGEVPFVVVGVMAARGAGPAGASLDNLILIPVSTASKRLFNRDFLTMLIARIDDPSRSDAVVSQIRNMLRSRHHLSVSALDDFTLTSPVAVMAQANAFSSTLQRLFFILGVLATIVGGGVILSLTLIGVFERRREIGVRRAIGANRTAVLLQFLMEAVIISFSGGIAGLAIGICAAQLVARWQRLPFLIDTHVVGISVLVSVGLGLLAGIYPAWRASRINPVEALRV